MRAGFGSYCDELGSPKDPNKTVMGIAGLPARSDDRIAHSEERRKIQDRENVPTIHTTDCVHQTEDFGLGKRGNLSAGWWRPQMANETDFSQTSLLDRGPASG